MKNIKPLINLTIIAAATVALLGFGVAEADASDAPGEFVLLHSCDGEPKLDGRGAGNGVHRMGASMENRGQPRGAGENRQLGVRDGSGPHHANPPRLGQQRVGEGKRIVDCDGTARQDRLRDGSGQGRGGAGRAGTRVK